MFVAEQVLPPVIAAMREEHPEISLDVHTSDDLRDLVKEGFDLALRLGPLPDSTLEARRLISFRRVVCAAPSLLSRVGTPAHPSALEHLPVLHYGSGPGAAWWKFVHSSGEVCSPIALLNKSANRSIVCPMNRDRPLLATLFACTLVSCSNARPTETPAGSAPATSSAAPLPPAASPAALPPPPPPLPRAPAEVYTVQKNIPEHLRFAWTSLELTPEGYLRLHQRNGADPLRLDPSTFALTRERFVSALCPASGPVAQRTALCARGAPVLAIAEPQLLTVERDGQKRALAPGFPVVAAALSPDGEAVAAAGGDGHVLVWSTREGRVLHERPGRPDLEPVQGVSWLGRGVIALVGTPARLVSLHDGSETVLHCAILPARPVAERFACAAWAGDRLDGDPGALLGVQAAGGAEPAQRALQGPKRHRGFLKERLGDFLAPGSMDARARRELLVRAYTSSMERGRVTRETIHGAFTLLDVEADGRPERVIVGELGTARLDGQAKVEREDLDFTGDGSPDLLVQDGSTIAVVRSEGPGEALQPVSRFPDERLVAVRPVDLRPLSTEPGFVIETRRETGPVVWLYAKNAVHQGGTIEGGAFPETSPLPGGRGGECEQSQSRPDGFEWRLTFRVTGGRIHELRTHRYQPTGPGQALVEQSYLPFVGGDASSGKRLQLSLLVRGQSSRTTLLDIRFQEAQFTVAGQPGAGTCKWTR